MFAVKRLLVLALTFALVFPAHIVLAAPSGGKVVGGQAKITQSGNTTSIKQDSNRSIVNWRSFDIGKNEAVVHTMPSAKSAGLHRVVGGGGASQIEGLLKSNGNIYLVNPAGIVLHKGARVETGGFAASTSDIKNEDFMQGKYLFNKPGQAGASVINQGNISVRDSGFAALVAPHVRNDGVIAAKLGKVALASTDSWKLDVYGDDLIAFTTPEKVVDTLHTVDGALVGVENKGAIKAEGGTVLLTARQLDGVVSSVVNNSGLISAASAEMAGGKIILKGEGARVDVNNTGTADASSDKSDGGSVRMSADGKAASSGTITATGGKKGGSVALTGSEVALSGKARVDASGNQGGGTVLVGGNAQGKGPEKNAQTTSVSAETAIKADAVTAGDGGKVVVWSDGKTTFDGTISAKGGADGGDGGWVETSGSILKVGDSAMVNTSAPAGKFGEWLLDPVDFIVAASGGDMTGVTLSANLARGNVTILSSSGSSGVNGDIFVNTPVHWASNSKLTLEAYRDVNVNADITASGNTAGLHIRPGAGTTGTYTLATGSKVTLSGATPSLSIFGESYTVINTLAALQNMNLNLAGRYALGTDIDASVTSSWSAENAFRPVGNESTPFTGMFHGGGHTITGLTIKRISTGGVGLFGYTNGAQVYNVGLLNASIVGYNYTGALVGNNNGSISRSYSTGNVVGGDNDIGGLVGKNSGSISHSYAIVHVTGGGDNVGGFVGNNASEGSIANSHSSGSIVGGGGGGNHVGIGGFVGLNSGAISSSYSTGSASGGEKGVEGIGGFVGVNASDGTIANSYSTASATGGSGYYYNDTGGFVGGNHGNISYSYSTGAVSGGQGTNSDTGGFAGWNASSGSISHSYSTGAVSGGNDGDDATGGFVGQNSGAISDSFSTGSSTGRYDVGGFAGDDYGTISNSYSVGSATGISNVGGFSGSGSRAENSYWDTQTSGLTTSAGGIGLTTAEMMQKASFNDWDFTFTWNLAEGRDYPKLYYAGLATGPGPVGGMTGTTPETPVTPTEPGKPDPDPGKPDPDPGKPDPDPGKPDPDPVKPTPGIDNAVRRDDLPICNPNDNADNTIQDKLNSSSNSNTQSPIDKNKSVTSNAEQFKADAKTYLDSLKEKLGQELCKILKAEEEKEKNARKRQEKAIKEIKDQLIYTPTDLSTARKYPSKSKVPDQIYEAFAMAINKAVEDSSKVDKFSTDPYELNKQIYNKIEKSFTNLDENIVIDGITYTIQGNISAMDGAGFGLCTVQWHEKNGNRMSLDLSWGSTPKKGVEALTKFCTAATELHTEAWKEASLYFLAGNLNAEKYIDVAQKVIEAICDNSKANTLAKEIGGAFEKEFTGWIFSKFDNFIRDNIPGGSSIVAAAKELDKFQKKYDEFVKIVESNANFAETKEAKSFIKSLEQLEKNCKYAKGVSHDLDRYLGI